MEGGGGGVANHTSAKKHGILPFICSTATALYNEMLAVDFYDLRNVLGTVCYMKNVEKCSETPADSSENFSCIPCGIIYEIR